MGEVINLPGKKPGPREIIIEPERLKHLLLTAAEIFSHGRHSMISTMPHDIKNFDEDMAVQGCIGHAISYWLEHEAVFGDE